MALELGNSASKRAQLGARAQDGGADQHHPYMVKNIQG